MEYERKCEWCNNDFVAKRKDKVFCSKKCKCYYGHRRRGSKKEKKDIEYKTNCSQCNNKLISKYQGKKFCNQICFSKFKYKNKIKRDDVNSEKIRFDNMNDFKKYLIGNNLQCEACSKEFPLECLCFHHKEQKDFELGRSMLYRYSKEQIENERKKTIVLCHNCHAILHHNEHVERRLENPLKRDSRYKEELRSRRKQILIDLLGGECVCCGWKSDVQDTFSFDHVRDKNFLLSKTMLGCKKWDDILEEVKNCELLCINCHQSKNISRVEDRRHSLWKNENERKYNLNDRIINE